MRFVGVIVACAVMAGRVSASSPAGWPEGFTASYFVDRGGALVQQEVVLGWNDALGGYVTHAGDTAFCLHGASLSAMNMAFYDPADNILNDGGTVDLSDHVGGSFVQEFNASGFFTFKDVLGYEYLPAQVCVTDFFNGVACGIALAICYMPVFELKNVFARLHRALLTA